VNKAYHYYLDSYPINRMRKQILRTADGMVDRTDNLEDDDDGQTKD